MASRTQHAIERAGALDRAHREAEVACTAVAHVYAALLNVDQEAAARFALVIMKIEEAVKAIPKT